MSESFITDKQLFEWLDDMEESLKNSIVNSNLGDSKAREEDYRLYQACQLFRARMLQDLRKEVKMPDYQYDPD